MNPTHRPLSGLAVTLSLSESDDSSRLGFPDWQVNRVTLQVIAALFGQGATVVFGHDWREDGVMEAVFGFAQQIQSPIPLSAAEAEATGDPLLWNLLPWPELPFLKTQYLESLSSTLRVEQAGLPPELQLVADQALHDGSGTILYKYLRARALTFLRHRLTEVCDARLCIGGHMTKYDGRFPGVVEEAFLALLANKPLYLAGLLGGATRHVGDALEGKPMPADFCIPAPLKPIYDQPPIEEHDASTRGDRNIDRVAIWIQFAQAGFQKLSTVNKLTLEENRELLHTQVLDRAIELVLTGLARVKSG